MPNPSLPLLLAALVLAGCAHRPEPVPVAPAGPAAHAPDSVVLHALSGSLLGVPEGAEVELALMQVDEKRRPLRLLASLRLRGQDHELPFLLQFNADVFKARQPVELRGRVTEDGRLTRILPPRRIGSEANQSLGPLQVVPAP